jgi:phage gpG-like protein
MMVKLFDIAGFIAELPAIERDLHATGPMIIKRACEILEKKAKSAIGREHEMWPDLAPSTIADKQAHGFPTPKPLLRTGELRDSISHVTSGNEGCVGSNSPIAVWQELGTKHIPPRSFLVSSAISSEDKIHKMAAAATIAAFCGHGRNAHDIREMLHLLHRAGHALKELGEEIFHDDDDEERKR